MLSTERKIDLFVKSAQADRDSILYLTERLYDVTNIEPDNDALRKCYSEVNNIAILLKDKLQDLGDNLSETETLVRELL